MTTTYRFDRQAMKRLRQAAGLSLEQLAIATGRTYPTLSSYEVGRSIPPTSTVAAICSALGCTPDDLLTPVVEDVAAIASRERKRSRKAQGLPANITAPAALDEAAELLRRQA